MGRIKTMLIKRTAHKLVNTKKDTFKIDFNENKKLVNQYAEIKSKKIRNAVAGYISRVVKREGQKAK